MANKPARRTPVVRFDNITNADMTIVDLICDRAFASSQPPVGNPSDLRLNLSMDLIAVHCNDCRIDFGRLLAFDHFNFWHDLNGISRFLDRSTGKLTRCFVPRSAARKAAEVTQ